jgi:hypothetical protein
MVACAVFFGGSAALKLLMPSDTASIDLIGIGHLLVAIVASVSIARDIRRITQSSSAENP